MFRYLFFILIPFLSYSQLQNEKENFYLEDQLYLGFTYIVLNNLPSGINQSGFSNSLSLGFIKDIPLNKNRNIGLGIGLGYAYDTFFQNIKISKMNGITSYTTFLEEDNYKKNKLHTNSIEIPLELRFRTSTRESYKFWRIYPGIKYSYIFSSTASYQLDGKQKVKSPKGINKSLFGLTLGVGYGTWNGYIYYGMNNLFDNVLLNNTEYLDTHILKIGFQFYIL